MTFDVSSACNSKVIISRASLIICEYSISGRQARLGLKASISARLFGSQGLTFLGTGPQDVESRE